MLDTTRLTHDFSQSLQNFFGVKNKNAQEPLAREVRSVPLTPNEDEDEDEEANEEVNEEPPPLLDNCITPNFAQWIKLKSGV